MTSPELDKAEPVSERLLILAAMIELGEKIAWGSDSALMREAASELAASRERERALERTFRLADAIACDAIRWGYFVSDGALQQLADARALADANTQGGGE